MRLLLPAAGWDLKHQQDLQQLACDMPLGLCQQACKALLVLQRYERHHNFYKEDADNLLTKS